MVCPEDRSPPAQPHVVAPDDIITAEQVFSVGADFSGGDLVSGTDVTLPVKWEPVPDDCEPVTYSVYFEAFGLDETCWAAHFEANTCGRGLYCDFDQSPSACVEQANSGEPCADDDHCAGGLVCDTDSADPTCVPR